MRRRSYVGLVASRRCRAEAGDEVVCVDRGPEGSPLQLADSFLSVGTDGVVALYDAGEQDPSEGAAGEAASQRRNSKCDAACVAVLSGHTEPVEELIWR